MSGRQHCRRPLGQAVNPPNGAAHLPHAACDNGPAGPGSPMLPAHRPSAPTPDVDCGTAAGLSAEPRHRRSPRPRPGGEQFKLSERRHTNMWTRSQVAYFRAAILTFQLWPVRFTHWCARQLRFDADQVGTIGVAVSQRLPRHPGMALALRADCRQHVPAALRIEAHRGSLHGVHVLFSQALRKWVWRRIIRPPRGGPALPPFTDRSGGGYPPQAPPGLIPRFAVRRLPRCCR